MRYIAGIITIIDTHFSLSRYLTFPETWTIDHFNTYYIICPLPLLPQKKKILRILIIISILI